MKKLKTVVIMSLMALIQVQVLAQNISLVSTDNASASFLFKMQDFSVNVQTVQGEPYTVISFQGSVPSANLGAPDLPVFSRMVEIPLCSEVLVRVSNVQVKQLDNAKYRLMPVQPAPSKSDRNPLPFVLDSALYATDAYYQLPAATVEKIGVARDRNLAVLRLSPLAYNPVTGEMQLITSMTVTLQYKDVDMVATEQMHSRYFSPDFTVGKNVLRAYPASKSVRLDAPLHYLIVSHSSFRGAFDSFVKWKRSQGLLVTVAYTDEAGVGTSSNAIANYIKGYYTNATEELPAPTFLLLIGDHQQIPAFNSRLNGSSLSDHVTDLYFATWTDGDIIPDCYYGRFSARNLAELTPQIEKTLLYEKYLFADDSYLGRGVLIAGQDQGRNGDNAYRYADPAMDYIAAYYLNAQNGYNDVRYYKNNTTFAPTGVTVTGSGQTSSTANVLRNLYNQGYGWINYSAHGYDNEWSTPSFNNNHAQSMTNYGMPSVMIGNCCLSGKFNTSAYDACLGEVLLRKGDNAGAVMYIGGTNSTYWPHDFCWSVGVRDNISNNMTPTYYAAHMGMYDRLFHTHNESFSAWHTTAGSMIMAGNAAVQEYSPGSYADYYWEIYELFGDPSLMPWLGAGTEMNVEASAIVNLGTESYPVIAAPYSYVALVDTNTYELIAAAYADETGMAFLTLPSDLMAGEYQLSVWAQNHIPFFQKVNVVVLDGPYVVVAEIKPTKGFLKPGQVTTFDVTLVNIGTQYPTAGLLNIESGTDGVMPVQPLAHFNSIAPGDSIRLTGICPTYITEGLPDGQRVKLTATVDFGAGTSTKRILYNIVAPSLVVVNPWLSPELVADSSSVITCQIVNRGSDTTDNVTITLPNLFGLMVGDAEPQHVGRIAPNDTVNLSIQVTMISDLPNTSIPFYLYSNDSCGAHLLNILSYRAGGSEMEDFETGTLDKFNWVQNSNPWETTSTNPFAGNFSARSKNGLRGRYESRMTINWTSTADDSISFVFKVSSEENYDVFRFFIDGVEMMSASGEMDWTRLAYPVRAGSHLFAFSYSKDAYVESGEDCAKVDNIKLPFSGDNSCFTIDSVCQYAEYRFGTTDISTDNPGIFNYSDTIGGQMEFLSLLVAETPQVSIEVVGNPAIGDCVMLKASGATSYSWNTGDSSAYISVCPQAAGEEYTVEGCRAGCCATASITLSVLGISPQTPPDAVVVYPNPAHDRVTVHAEQINSVEFVSLIGQTVLRKKVAASDVTLDLQKLPKGVYFVRVETANGIDTEKLVLR